MLSKIRLTNNENRHYDIVLTVVTFTQIYRGYQIKSINIGTWIFDSRYASEVSCIRLLDELNNERTQFGNIIS